MSFFVVFLLVTLSITLTSKLTPTPQYLTQAVSFSPATKLRAKIFQMGLSLGFGWSLTTDSNDYSNRLPLILMNIKQIKADGVGAGGWFCIFLWLYIVCLINQFVSTKWNVRWQNTISTVQWNDWRTEFNNVWIDNRTTLVHLLWLALKCDARSGVLIVKFDVILIKSY